MNEIVKIKNPTIEGQEHRCKKDGDFCWGENREWTLIMDFCNHIKFCPFCGKKLICM